MSNELAPKGHVYMCGACGKRSKDLYGDQSIDWGWDGSCVMNAVLVTEQQAEESRKKAGIDE